MAETINLKKRLIGKEDITFDITGTGETETFFSADGGQKTLSKINASHFPLTQDGREKLSAANVDEALMLLSDKVDNFDAGDVLTEDVTVEFLPEDDVETIQNKIGQQKKNLNGHTLTFLFPSGLQQNLYSTLVWQDFFNGSVIIAGGSSGNRIVIYDRQDITSLFRIYRCQCEVKIQHFYFVHQYSVYGISAESSAAVVIENCQFSGMEDVDSYAVNKSASNVILNDCELSEDIEYYPPPEESGIGKALGEIFAYPSAVPPEGAYLLNGQTITGCSELYPDFWNWVITAGVRSIDDETFEAELASAGVCGGFVIDSAAGSVRLPDLRNGTLWGADSITIGQSLAAGLPNITGNTGYINVNDSEAPFAGALYASGNVGTSSAGTGQYGNIVYMDASRSNSIYGNSDTVQPPAIRVSWCIQVFNAATALSEQESAQLASEMQMKAQTDLANVDSNNDWVVESWTDGAGGWYRKYRSGWVEQGGIITDAISSAARTLTLPVEMANSNFLVFTTNLLYNSGILCCPERNETSFQYRINTDISNTVFAWMVKGYAATE